MNKLFNYVGLSYFEKEEITLMLLVVLQRGLVEFICSVFVCSWTGIIKYHGPRPSPRPKQVDDQLPSFLLKVFENPSIVGPVLI
jgi:hypothetical protein